MVHVGTGEELGGINLRVGSGEHIERYAGHIGYHVQPEYRGHRFAARSIGLLVPLARRHGFDIVWITCDPDNAASKRTAELAGAKFVEIVDVPETCIIYQAGHPRKCRYRLICAPAPRSALIA
jgi:predicted acetyltransferase